MQSSAAQQSGSTDSSKRSWPDWRGETAVCIANGPSLTAEQVRWASQHRTIAVNHAIQWHPSADVWYAADDHFWKFNHRRIGGLKVGAETGALDSGWVDLMLKVAGNPEAETYTPGQSTHGQHSGFQALVMALTFGATRVYLLGYDCRAYGGKTNAIRKQEELQRDSPYKTWPPQYRRLKLPNGAQVINATPGSAITAFPFESVC